MREEKKKYIFKEFESLKMLYHYYFDHGNLLETESQNEKSDQYNLEYLDNSKYHGDADINERRGILIK
jgi:hypothetical protein